MKRFRPTLFLITGVTLFSIGTISSNRSHVAIAQEAECFMVNPSGQTVNLSRLCGGNSSAGVRTTPDVFQAPIKRRQGGTPVVDVTFNGQHTFEMLLDTGASQTTITPAMAAALRFVPTGTERARVANGDVLEFPMGRVASIAVGGMAVNDTVVSVGAVPLLGQNFFGGYDITIKQNVVEFRIRR